MSTAHSREVVKPAENSVDNTDWHRGPYVEPVKHIGR